VEQGQVTSDLQEKLEGAGADLPIQKNVWSDLLRGEAVIGSWKLEGQTDMWLLSPGDRSFGPNGGKQFNELLAVALGVPKRS
jgi:hypothetical protein